ncbi:MAG: hypothetical protein ABR501_04235 [Pyrinomonadaceae bacterium]
MEILRRKFAILALLLTVSIAVPLTRSSSAQLDQWGYWKNGLTESWWFSSEDFTKDDALNAVARWDEIAVSKQEAPKNEWAGDYFRGGETHGTYFRWSPAAGFIMAAIDKCQARVMSVSYGSVKVSTTLVEFYPDFERTAKHQGHMQARPQEIRVMKFVPIELNGDRFLVAEHEMPDFGNYVAGLGRYNFSDFAYAFNTEFFVKRSVIVEDDHTNAKVIHPVINNKPLLPEAYVRFLKKPIEASVISVGRRVVRKTYSYENEDGTGASYFAPVSLTSVKINAGSIHGLRSGMFIRVAKSNEGERIRILRVGKYTSTGIVIRSLGENGVETFFDSESEKPKPYSRVTSGWVLTTSPF